jgi:nucleotide-binding universal stress UspA family protein
MWTIREILHPSDFSPAARPAFEKAIGSAKAFRARLLIVHVLPPLPMDVTGYMAPETWDRILEDQRGVAQRQLDRMRAKARAAGVSASSLLIDAGSAHEQIVRAARRRRIGLIVMGTHGRTGLARALLGSVASRVVAMASCPVLTVHAR